MKTENFEFGQHVRVELSGLLAATENVEMCLSNFFSRFGEIRKIGKFDHHGKGCFYAIDFVDNASAVHAANATGCCKFGFNAVLVDPERLKPS